MSKKTLSKKSLILLLIVTIFLSGNILLYLKERAKWIYPGQPYPEAKEWLVPANMMLVYGTTLTKLPFIDERSLIMQPVIGLQDYFVSKWQENLPDDDAEKYLGWYFFKYENYIVPNSESVFMYYKNNYSYQETRIALDEMWNTLNNIHRYEARDKDFAEIRYAAFNNLSYAYIANETIYWYFKVQPEITLDLQHNEVYALDKKMMLNDKEKMNRYFLLFNWIDEMNIYYKKNHLSFYNKSKNDLAENARISKIISAIMFVYYETKSYEEIDDFCNIESNEYIAKHMESKNKLKQILKMNNQSKVIQQGIQNILENNADEHINKMCKNLK